MDQRGSKSHVRGLGSKSNVKSTPSGKVSRNPFLNFLRDFRKSNKSTLQVTELTRRGAQLWRGMSDREKSPYINISKQAPKYRQTRRRRRRRKRGRRRRSRRRRRHRSRSASSSITTESSYDRKREKKKEKREREKKRHDNEKHKERNSKENNNKPEKPTHGNKEANNKKPADEYELKYKNSRYEESRDFI